MDLMKDREIRTMASSSRGRDFFWTMTIVIFSNVATAGMITSGYTSLSLAVVVIVVNVFGFLGGGSAIDDLAAFSADMDEEQKKSNAGQSFGSRPYGAFKALSQFFCAAMLLVQLYEMFT